MLLKFIRSGRVGSGRVIEIWPAYNSVSDASCDRRCRCRDRCSCHNSLASCLASSGVKPPPPPPPTSSPNMIDRQTTHAWLEFSHQLLLQNLWKELLTLWRPLLPYRYSSEASCGRPGSERQSARMSKITGTGCYV